MSVHYLKGFEGFTIPEARENGLMGGECQSIKDFIIAAVMAADGQRANNIRGIVIALEQAFLVKIKYLLLTVCWNMPRVAHVQCA